MTLAILLLLWIPAGFLAHALVARHWWETFSPIYERRFGERPHRLGVKAQWQFNLWKSGMGYSEPFPEKRRYYTVLYLVMALTMIAWFAVVASIE